MIEINFLNSPDPEVLGTYKVFYDSISIGSSPKNDLIIEDPKVLDFHIILTSSEDGLICEGATDMISFRANDQYFKGKKTNITKKELNQHLQVILFELGTK